MPITNHPLLAIAAAAAIATILAGGTTAASASDTRVAGQPLVLKTISTQQLNAVGVRLLTTNREPRITRQAAIEVARQHFSFSKVLETAVGTVQRVSPPHSYFAWIISAWPPPQPAGYMERDKSSRSGFLLIFVDASTGKWLFAVSQSPAPRPNPCDMPMAFFHPLQRIYRRLDGRWTRPRTHYDRRIGQHLPAIYTGERVRFSITVSPGRCLHIASVHLRLVRVRWNRHGEPVASFCSCRLGPRVKGRHLKPGVVRFMRPMHFLLRPRSHLLALDWSILTTEHAWIGIQQLVRVYTPKRT